MRGATVDDPSPLPLGVRRIYAGVRTGDDSGAQPDFTGAPLGSAAASLVLPFAPKVMFVRAGWQIYSGGARLVEGYSEGIYAEGDTHVRARFGNISWAEFDNIGVLDDDTLSVSVGLISSDVSYSHAWTIEYAPLTRTVSILAVNDPPSSRRPVVRSLIIAGS